MSVSKQEQVYKEIRARILAGRYGPGYRLVLPTLAREFEVSEVPVREAVRRLEAEGWLDYVRNVGANVKEMDEVAILETIQTLAVLEGYATALAAPHMSRNDLARPTAINDQMGEVLKQLDPLAFTALNREFHTAIIAYCPNQHLKDQIMQEWDRMDALRRSLFIHRPQRAAASVVEHQEILSLIRSAAPPAEIERVVREHKMRMGAQLSPSTDGAPSAHV